MNLSFELHFKIEMSRGTEGLKWVFGRVKTKSDLVVRQIFAFFCSPRDRRAQNTGCGYTA
jgi:hypothetical protein